MDEAAGPTLHQSLEGQTQWDTGILHRSLSFPFHIILWLLSPSQTSQSGQNQPQCIQTHVQCLHWESTSGVPKTRCCSNFFSFQKRSDTRILPERYYRYHCKQELQKSSEKTCNMLEEERAGGKTNPPQCNNLIKAFLFPLLNK